MKKRIQYAVLLAAIVLAHLSGCGSKDSPLENTPDNTSIVSPVATYDQYAGTWAQEEIGWLNGGVILDISVDSDRMNVAYLEICSSSYQ